MVSISSSIVFSGQVSAANTPFWVENAYSRTGDIVTTPPLKEGYQYQIIAQEIFWYNYAGCVEADAMYYTTETASWQWNNQYPCPDGHSFLQMNGKDVNWGPFSNGDQGHTYYTVVDGHNEPVTFQVRDWIDADITNNNCHIAITIYEIPIVLGMVPKMPTHTPFITIQTDEPPNQDSSANGAVTPSPIVTELSTEISSEQPIEYLGFGLAIILVIGFVIALLVIKIKRR